MTIERPNLADAFTSKPPAVDRAAALAGLLPPARPKSSQHVAPPTAAEEPAPQTLTAVAEPSSDAKRNRAGKPTRPPQTTKAAPLSESAETIVNVGVYLEPDLLELTRAARRSTGITYDELVVNAFAEVSDEQIEQTFQRARSHDEAAGMPARQRRLRGTAGIQIQLRLSNHQRAWLDTKTEAVGAPSRSALVATALRLHLDR